MSTEAFPVPPCSPQLIAFIRTRRRLEWEQVVAKGDQIPVVSYSIGGNDVGFADVVEEPTTSCAATV